MKFGWLVIIVTAVSISLLVSCNPSGPAAGSSTTMYVTTRGSAQVWGYRSSLNNGNLTSINGSPFAAEQGATAIVINPTHNFAYVANAAPSNDIGRYSIDLNGSFVPISGNQSVGTNPVAIAMDPAGKFLFIANQGSSNISVFSVGSNASLTQVAGSPFAVMNPFAPSSPASPVALAVAPSANFLYVADQIDNLVFVFKFDTSTGALSTNPVLPPVPVGASPAAIAISPNDRFLYVANQGSNNLSAFTIDTNTGDQTFGGITPISSPYPTDPAPVSAAVDPSGQFLYVVDEASNQISGFRIAAVSGALSALSNSPYNTGRAPVFVAISPVNKYLYVSNNVDATISSFTIDPSSGNLGPNSAAVTTGSQPAGIAFGR